MRKIGVSLVGSLFKSRARGMAGESPILMDIFAPAQSVCNPASCIGIHSTPDWRADLIYRRDFRQLFFLEHAEAGLLPVDPGTRVNPEKTVGERVLALLDAHRQCNGYIAYRLGVEPGKLVQTSTGWAVMFVDAAEYFSRMLDFVTSVCDVLVRLQHLPRRERAKAEAAVIRRFSSCGGCLIPPIVAKALIVAGDTTGEGPFWNVVEEIRRDVLIRPETYDEATTARLYHRARALELGADGWMNDLQTAMLEFFTDLLFLEKAYAFDLLTADSMAGRSKLCSDVLADPAFRRVSDEAIRLIFEPPDITEQRDSRTMERLAAYASKRHSWSHIGVLA